MYEYKAKVVRVIDGDTIVFDIDLGFNIIVKDESVRLAGINAPEVRTKDLEEKAKGLAAKLFVENVVGRVDRSGGYFTLETAKSNDKFGRYLAYVNVHIPNETSYCLNENLVLTNHAVVF